MPNRAVPTKLKVIRGNPGKRPLNQREPEHDSAAMTAPIGLSEAEIWHFETIRGRLARENRASASHTEVVAIAARAMAEIEECSAVINENGRVYETTTPAGDKMIRPRPEVAQRATALRLLASALGELGLTPSASTKVIAPKSAEPSQLARLLGKG